MRCPNCADWVCVILGLTIITLGLPSTLCAQGTVHVSVAGWSDPWLAGMPDGSWASCYPSSDRPPESTASWISVCDYAPEQSPQLVAGLELVGGEELTFTASGQVAHDPGYPLVPPDGSWEIAVHGAGAQNGISDITAPYDCLVGVFLTDEAPDVSPAPAGLDFGSQTSRDYLTLSPVLKQVFFIGDGLSSPGDVQRVIVPTGATRLFLGTMDSTGWYNNIGSFDVGVTGSAPTAVTTRTWGTVKARYR